jgi:cysteinyl-tRNA synthetase
MLNQGAVGRTRHDAILAAHTVCGGSSTDSSHARRGLFAILPAMLNLFKKRALLPAPRPLYLYNSAKNSKEEFTSLKPGDVKMYTCGPTVYDYAHIGNLRAFLMADTLKRTLIYNGYRIENTVNFTDFGHLTDDADAGEDKMMKGLKREGKPITLSAMRELADRYIDAFLEDWTNLRLLEPSHWTRASEYVRQQIRLIETLEEKGYAYQTGDGLYFDIANSPPTASSATLI